ncbi:MAG: uracil-DNA glycosylase, partial [Gemmatirosa sp.]
MLPRLPTAWKAALATTVKEPWYAALAAFVDAERSAHEVHPPRDELFAALALTPPDAVKALILGQDPYHGPGQAHGLCFSVREGVALPPSLVNIYKELKSDLGIEP